MITAILHDKEQAKTALAYVYRQAKPLLVDGVKLVVTVKKQTRSDAQNRLLHGALTDIANQVEWEGRKFDVVVWKRLCVASWLRENGEEPDLIPSLDGLCFDVIYEKTSKLDKAQCSSLIEWCFAFGGEHGVKFRDMG